MYVARLFVQFCNVDRDPHHTPKAGNEPAVLTPRRDFSNFSILIFPKSLHVP